MNSSTFIFSLIFDIFLDIFMFDWWSLCLFLTSSYRRFPFSSIIMIEDIFFVDGIQLLPLWESLKLSEFIRVSRSPTWLKWSLGVSACMFDCLSLGDCWSWLCLICIFFSIKFFKLNWLRTLLPLESSFFNSLLSFSMSL